jgi:hypothetical protein
MPKQCKPTYEAINKRIDAYIRHLEMHDAYNYPSNVIPIEIFGIKHRLKREGYFTMENILEELKK